MHSLARRIPELKATQTMIAVPARSACGVRPELARPLEDVKEATPGSADASVSIATPSHCVAKGLSVGLARRLRKQHRRATCLQACELAAQDDAGEHRSGHDLEVAEQLVQRRR